MRSISKWTLAWTLLFAFTSHAAEPLQAKITAVGFEYANITTDLDFSALVGAGVKMGQSFEVAHGERRLKVTLGGDYGDVEVGNWVALAGDGDKVELAISFGHACTEINCTVGDVLTIHPGSAKP